MGSFIETVLWPFGRKRRAPKRERVEPAAARSAPAVPVAVIIELAAEYFALRRMAGTGEHGSVYLRMNQLLYRMMMSLPPDVFERAMEACQGKTGDPAWNAVMVVRDYLRPDRQPFPGVWFAHFANAAEVTRNAAVAAAKTADVVTLPLTGDALLADSRKRQEEPDQPRGQ